MRMKTKVTVIENVDPAMLERILRGLNVDLAPVKDFTTPPFEWDYWLVTNDGIGDTGGRYYRVLRTDPDIQQTWYGRAGHGHWSDCITTLTEHGKRGHEVVAVAKADLPDWVRP